MDERSMWCYRIEAKEREIASRPEKKSKMKPIEPLPSKIEEDLIKKQARLIRKAILKDMKMQYIKTQGSSF